MYRMYWMVEVFIEFIEWKRYLWNFLDGRCMYRIY